MTERTVTACPSPSLCVSPLHNIRAQHPMCAPVVSVVSHSPDFSPPHHTRLCCACYTSLPAAAGHEDGINRKDASAAEPVSTSASPASSSPSTPELAQPKRGRTDGSSSSGVLVAGGTAAPDKLGDASKARPSAPKALKEVSGGHSPCKQPHKGVVALSSSTATLSCFSSDCHSACCSALCHRLAFSHLALPLRTFSARRCHRTSRHRH